MNKINEKSPRSGMNRSITDRILLLSVYAVGLALISLQLRSLL